MLVGTSLIRGHPLASYRAFGNRQLQLDPKDKWIAWRNDYLDDQLDGNTLLGMRNIDLWLQAAHWCSFWLGEDGHWNTTRCLYTYIWYEQVRPTAKLIISSVGKSNPYIQVRPRSLTWSKIWCFYICFFQWHDLFCAWWKKNEVASLP